MFDNMDNTPAPPTSFRGTPITPPTSFRGTRPKSTTSLRPLDDNRFKDFLQNADEIESIEHFTYWKDEFFETFRQYLDPMGTATARESDEELYFELERLAKFCLSTKTLLKEGKITPEKSSVKGQKSINEMVSCMDKCETSIDKYLPKTQDEEAICGYSKFELAAVAVRDGFRVYGLMVATRDYVQALIVSGEVPLEKVLKPNQMSIIQFYFRRLESFTQTMADLGMFKLMQKCEEIYKVRPRRKKNKKKKFDRNGSKDALSDTSCDDDAVSGGRMFHKPKQQFKSIMDNGWSNGIDKGQEIKPPPTASTSSSIPKKKKKKNKLEKTKKKKKDKSGSTTLPGTDGESGEDGKGIDNDDEKENKNKNGDPAAKVAAVAAAVAAASGAAPSLDAIGESDNDESSSSSDESSDEEEDKEFIYYFDPVKQIVGKVSRKKCLAENVIFTTTTIDDENGTRTSTEHAEGIVEEWESKDGQMGKSELILKLKEILRGRAKDKD